MVVIVARIRPFVEACETLLAEGPAARARRELQMLSVVSASSWDRSVRAVHVLILQALSCSRDSPHDAASRSRREYWPPVGLVRQQLAAAADVEVPRQDTEAR